MGQYSQKIKLVILPLLALSLVFMLGYTLLYWLLCIETKIITAKQEMLQLWIPGAAALLLVFIIIRPRIHLLKLDADNGRVRGLYYMMAAAVVFVPLLLLLKYVDTATGKRVELNHISDIGNSKNVKYYTVTNAFLDKSRAGIETAMSYSGKHNEKIHFNIYIAIPFVGKDSNSSAPAFLAIKYDKQISSRGDDTEHDMDWRIFRDRSMRDFDAEDFAFRYLERMPNTKDQDQFIEAAKNSAAYSKAGAVHILSPVYSAYENRNGNKLNYVFLAIGIGWAVWFLLIIFVGVHTEKAKDFASGQSFQYRTYIRNLLLPLLPRKGFAATPVLIALNILAFIIMVFYGQDPMDFSSKALLQAGALYKPAVQQGEWWRLFIAIFLHGGLIHLAMNMLSLALAGIFTEESLGTKKFIVVYLIAGIGAGLISMAWHSKPIVAVGASGAIFGMFGLMLAFALLKKFEEGMGAAILIILACTAGFSLLMGLVTKGIDNSAHFGGLIIGFICGCIFPGKEKLKGSALLRLTRDTKKDRR